ncbi:hypothetical protein ACFQHV_05450 [Promicromonospora thailandica]|uniref:Uncharacterized protein n=1 Tax=Promicromonospora thailandica TaxID=765201 RepID=A0A9X2G1A4_9MICO|nr:hypothetical protein [Promicromonospora thailandica]MCP2263843.1 hypothetical protein [Promicromonospora thailandica]BFF17860.1 hypothetical protein GCM10025730_13810 [Promicromonospora thailandica]
MSTDALPEQAQAAQGTAAGETATEGTAPETAPQPTTDVVAAPVTDQDPGQTPAPEGTAEREENLETRTAARLHQLVASGAEKLPGEAGSTVSRLAVALLSFGSQAAKKDQDKPPTALMGEAVQLYKSLDDDDPGKQREVLEHALETFTTSTLGGKERSQVLEVAEEAMSLWGKLRGTTSELVKSDAATSMRSLAGALRKEGRDEEADETEKEAGRLES